MAAFKFSPDELETVRLAVKEAESKTAGEIATAFIKESYDYAVYELLAAVIGGFFYFIVMMFFSTAVEGVMRNMFWDYSTDLLLIFYGLSTFLVIFILYFFANVSFVDRLVVPKAVMRRKVNERAVRHFMESGVYNTKDRTGILIFVSQLEHRVELLADKGINDKIPQEKWDEIVAHIIRGIKTRAVVKHLCDAVAQCGDLLAEHFPIQPDDVNELKDDIAVLER